MNSDLRLLTSLLDLIGLFRVSDRLRLDAFKADVYGELEPIEVAHLLRQHGDEHALFELPLMRRSRRGRADEIVLRQQSRHRPHCGGLQKISSVTHKLRVLSVLE